MPSQGAYLATRIGALEAQVKTLMEIVGQGGGTVRGASRENSITAQLSKSRSDLELLAERYSTLEARAATDARTLAERESDLAKVRLAVRNLALELGTIFIRTQSWEKARGYLEQATEMDPRNAEAWYGLGEVYFQLGRSENSKQMYEKAKRIY